MDQDWDEIERPDPDHPDWDHLWMVNVALGKLRRLRENPNLINAFVRQVDFHAKEFHRLADFLRSREHRIAFVGSIGVGKSTAICKLVGLVKPGENRLIRETVLETGAGGTTLCEVRIVAGPKYGLRIVPRSNESIRRDVEDYAEHLIPRAVGGNVGGQGGVEDHDVLGISKEVVRAIRNMAGLVGRRERTDEIGKAVPDDLALELAARHPNVDALADAILSRMDLPRRTRCVEWRAEDDGTTPMQWLQDVFKSVNNGRHPHFTLPERIDVVLPQPILASGRFPVTIIDTKGVDQTAERQDLEYLFDDPRTVVVLCSRFRDAPEVAIQTLLLRAREVGARDVEHKSILLVLPQGDEARDAKDERGFEAENDEQGYFLKRDSIDLSLRHLKLPNLHAYFYNAKHEPEGPTREVIATSIDHYRQLYRDAVERLVEDVDDLISNQEDIEVGLAFQEVERRLSVWIEKNRELDWDDGRLQDDLVAAIGGARYASTIRAAVNRHGDWDNLNYYHHLGHGARRLAVPRIGGKVEEFRITVTNAIDDEELAPARTFLGRVVARLELAAADAYRSIQEVAREAFRRELQQDDPFWQGCRERWGRGSGYREDVRDRTARQLATNCDDAHLAVRELVAEEWVRIIALLEEMLEDHEGRACGPRPTWSTE